MGSSRDGCLWGAAVIAVILLALAAVGWSIAMDRGSKLAEAESGLADAHKLSDKLSKDLDGLRATIVEAKSALTDQDAANEEQKLRAAALQEKLQDAEGALRERASQIASLVARGKELSGAKDQLTADLRAMNERYQTARKAASGKADLLDKIDAANMKAASLERRVAEELKSAAAIEAAKKDVIAQLEQANLTISERDELIAKLKRELADIPVMPLPDELAEARYHEFLKEVAKYTDREHRVSKLFRAKLALAGSLYEAKADAMWRREIRQKRLDADRAARAVYEKVTSKTRLHADAHDENIKLLSEALEKVRGSPKYERVIQQLIDREHVFKASGR